MNHGIAIGTRLACSCAIVLSTLCQAQSQTGPTAPSPYAELDAREIKALSSQQISSYLSGHGMGLALAAELNGYPGPKHVLELARELDLTDVQETRVTAVFDAMVTDAIELGRRIVAAERALDAAFANESITRQSLDGAMVDIGALQGRLRAIHLHAHLEARALLTPAQLRSYDRLRGYAAHDAAKTHRGHH